MMRLLLFLMFVSFSAAFASAQSELDEAYFGLEFKDVREAVQVAWVDPVHKSAQSLNIGDVVQKAGDVAFNTAAELTAGLKLIEPGGSVRFEVLALTDPEPRRPVVRSEKLRDAVPRRFSKVRDRETKQLLIAPKLPASAFYVAVAKDYNDKLLGLRLRFYAKDQLLIDHGKLVIAWRPDGGRDQFLEMDWKTSHICHPGLSELDKSKILTLSDSQLRSVRRQAFLDFSPEETSKLREIIETTRRERFRWRIAGSYRTTSSTEDEQRNFESVLLLYQILQEDAQGE